MHGFKPKHLSYNNEKRKLCIFAHNFNSFVFNNLNKYEEQISLARGHDYLTIMGTNNLYITITALQR